ncbi:ABC transporter ATP-binding protein [Eubacterium sp. 1001713B170207_170306_E7]|uniref:ABC transporter ATP-binding protein n=1 Tax=Eubacterium sp. 1001713B170207_170306_E7 TaxID=2787097 RepID=UPI001A9B7F59|nr:ABC transporter ATP-binding protein [Eubacterium sp. 1001713B170207_170306_E7]
MKYLIEIIDGKKSFHNKIVLENINLKVIRGKKYGIIGNNGSGKSVLLKLIVGFYCLDEGIVKYNNSIIRRDIQFIQNSGIVIDNPSFIESLTGYENLKIISEIKNVVTEKQIQDILRTFKLDKYSEIKVKDYSLGMLQKLRIAQAIFENPELLILDEPTNGLDSDTVDLIYEILLKYVDNGGTLIFTSHNSKDISILCDEIYQIKDKKIIN